MRNSRTNTTTARTTLRTAQRTVPATILRTIRRTISSLGTVNQKPQILTEEGAFMLLPLYIYDMHITCWLPANVLIKD